MLAGRLRFPYMSAVGGRGGRLCRTRRRGCGLGRGYGGWLRRQGMLVSVAGSGEGSGGCACEAADALQRFDEVGKERIARREAQDEPSSGATDGAGDGDEAEAQTFRVAGALALGQREQLQPGEQVEGEQRDEQIRPVSVEALARQVVEAESELGLLDLVFEVRLRPVPALELVGGAFL